MVVGSGGNGGLGGAGKDEDPVPEAAIDAIVEAFERALRLSLERARLCEGWGSERARVVRPAELEVLEELATRAGGALGTSYTAFSEVGALELLAEASSGSFSSASSSGSGPSLQTRTLGSPSSSSQGQAPPPASGDSRHFARWGYSPPVPAAGSIAEQYIAEQNLAEPAAPLPPPASLGSLENPAPWVALSSRPSWGAPAPPVPVAPLGSALTLVSRISGLPDRVCVGCGRTGPRWYVQVPRAGPPPVPARVFHGRWAAVKEHPDLDPTPFPKGFGSYAEAKAYLVRRCSANTEVRVLCLH